MKRKESKSEKRGTATRTQRTLARGFLLALGAAMVMVFAPAQSAQGAAGQQVRAGVRSLIQTDGASAVYDYQDFLSDEEEADLTSRFAAFEKEHGIKMFLMTPGVQQVGGYTDQDSINYIEAFAENTIGTDSIGLLVNMDTRYFYIDIFGDKSINAFTDDKQEQIESAVIECLYTEDIYGAGVAFAKEADRLVDYDPRAGRTVRGGVLSGVIGLIGSLGLVASKSKKHREKAVATDADIYADPASLLLSLNRDNFSHQYITRVARIQNSRGGGFGSGFGGHTTTHTSFGGHSHSGGGGHF